MKITKYAKPLLVLLCALLLLPSALLRADDGVLRDSTAEQRRFDYYFLEATRLRIAQKHDASYEMLMHCLALRPNSADVMYELAQYYIVLKENDRGIAAMERAVELAPTNYWYSQGLANLYIQGGNLEKATTLLERMGETFPNNTDVLYALLQTYNRTGAFEKSIALLDKLEERLGKNEQLSMQKYAIYSQQGEPDKAEAELQGLIDKYPDDYRYQVALGDEYMDNGKTQQAYDIYRHVLAEDPDNAQATYSMAAYYQKTGDTQRYEQQLDSVLMNRNVDTDTKTDVMRRIIARSESEHRDSTEVISLFDRILSQDQDDADLPFLYAQYLYSKGMEQQAVPVLRQVLQIDPTNTAARMTLLGEAVKKEDYKQVIDLCQTGTEANPDMLEFYYYLAVGYNSTQQNDSVISTCRRALTHVSDDSDKSVVSDFYAIMGDAYHTKNLVQETFAAYDSALVWNANNIVALNNYAYYLSLEHRDLDRAEEMSYKTVKAEPDNATYLDTYAWILFEKQNYVQAKIYIDMALKNDSTASADILEHAGDIYAQSGDNSSAVTYWQQAKQKGSTSETLEQKIRQRKYIRGK